MKKLLVFLVMLLVSSVVEAGYELEYDVDGDSQIYRYMDSKHSKIIMQDDDAKSHIIKNTKSIYIVTYKNNGAIDTLDMKAMKRQASQFGFDTSQYTQKPQKPNFKITKTSKRKKIAGVNGEIWILHDADHSSQKGEKVVVTNDKDVVKAVHSMFGLLGDVSGGEADNAFIELQKGYVTIQAPGMMLKHFKKTSVSADEFKIPHGKLSDSKGSGLTNSKMTSNKSSLKPDCYDSVCCLKKVGASVVLINSLPKKMNVPGDFTLTQSATCKKSKNSVTEAAIYTSPSEGSRIYVTLKINTKDKPVVEKSETQRKSAAYTIHSATFEEIGEEISEVTFEHNSLLTFSRLKKENKPYYKWIDTYVVWSGVTDANSKLAKNIQKYDFNKVLAGEKTYPKNYKNIVCKGKSLSKSKILVKYINANPESNFLDFSLYEVAKCNKTNTEEAIFIRRGGYETYKVIINFHDKKDGVIKNKPRSKVKYYTEGSHYGDTYSGAYKGRYYSDYILGNGVSVSFSKNIVNDPLIGGWNDLTGISMSSNIDFDKLIPALNPEFATKVTAKKAKKKSVHKPSTKSNSHSIDDAVTKEATKLFKSFW